jgi:hypothetical protein
MTIGVANGHFAPGEDLRPSETTHGLIVLDARDLNYVIQPMSQHPALKNERWEIDPQPI